MPTTLRDYQREALDRLYTDWRDGYRNLGIALPTGTGKGRIMVELANTESNTLILLHRDTLVEQTVRILRAQHPEMDIGVVKAARDETDHDVIVASVHTLRRAQRRARLRQPNLAIVDEAHVSVSDTYRAVFAELDPKRMAGFTATWTRSDNRGLGDVWEKISYRKSIRWAIAHRHLVPVRGIQVGEPPDLSEVRSTGGDYNEHDLGEAVSTLDIKANVVRGYLEHADGKHAVLFAPTTDAAEYFRAALCDAGVRSEGIYHNTAPAERHEIFERYRTGETKVLTTCTALAEGWDAPYCSVALMVRPTQHSGLYIQQVGRILRPFPGKSEAIVLDFVGACDDKSLHAFVDLSPSSGPAKLPELDEDEPGETDGEREDTRVRKLVGTQIVDLFAGTRARWLRTGHGVPFLATAKFYLILGQKTDGWAIWQCGKSGVRGGRWLISGVDIDAAMDYASDYALEAEPQLADRKASWRRKGNMATEAQRGFAARLGIEVSELTRAEASDAIEVTLASQVMRDIPGVQI